MLGAGPYSSLVHGRVLIVDDDADVCDFLETALSGAGFEAETRSDGESAIGAFRDKPFDVVVTDVRMPRMDGLQVLRSLKAIDPDVGVIIFSGTLEEQTRIAIDALRGGAADYFTKPLENLGEMEHAIAAAVDRREARREQSSRVRDLERRARTDPLTGLANRLELDQRLLEEFSRLGRGVDEFALALLDIDSFKVINDTCGHLAGDDVLKSVAVALRDSCRAYDVKARYGGDEFVVVMPYTRLDQGVAVADKIRRAVAALPLPVRSGGLSLTLSAGVTSTVLREGITPEGLIQRADLALYEAKNGGRNRTVPLAHTEPDAEVLVVDGDEERAREILRLCESLGCRVEWARTGSEAAERARRSRHVLALVDSSLTDLEGIEAIARIKEISPATSTALVTGTPANGHVLEALLRSPITLVGKPLSIEHLKTLLSDARRRS